MILGRQKPSLHQRWEGYIGEKRKDQDPSFTTHRSSIIGRSEVLVEVYGGDADEEYHIEGSYSKRCCTVYKSSRESSLREPKAEIKRKVDPSTHVMLGKDVFSLLLKPGFDGAFAMGLVLILDQMYGDQDDGDDVDKDSREVSPQP